MMDITAILHMHAELSLTAVFILMFLLDLFLPAPQRHWLRPMACILLTIQLLANLWPEEVTLFGGMYHSTPMASVLIIPALVLIHKLSCPSPLIAYTALLDSPWAVV